MGSGLRALVVAIGTVFGATWLASCTFGIDTDGLAGDGGTVMGDATTKLETSVHHGDAIAPETGRHDARSEGDAGRDASHHDVMVRNDTGVDGGGVGGDGGQPEADAPSTDSGHDAGSDGTIPPCNVVAVATSPGTAEYHVEEAGTTDQMPITTTTGNLLVAIAYAGQGQTTSAATTTPNMVFAVHDSLGNTFYPGPMYEDPRWNQSAVQFFYSPNIKGGTDVVYVATTNNDSPGVQQTGMFVQEYSGLATSEVVDIATGRSAPDAATSTLTPPAMAVAAGCHLVIAAFADGHVDPNFDAGGGFHLRSSDQWDPSGAADNAPGTIGLSSPAPVFHIQAGPDNGWVAAEMAFRGLGAPTPAHMPSKLAVTTASQDIKVDVCSAAVVVASEDSASAAAVTTTGIEVDLSGTAGLTFYADDKCADVTPTVLIGAGTSSAQFYFMGTTATGTTSTTITLSLPLTASITGTSQAETISATVSPP